MCVCVFLCACIEICINDSQNVFNELSVNPIHVIKCLKFVSLVFTTMIVILLIIFDIESPIAIKGVDLLVNLHCLTFDVNENGHWPKWF